MVCMKAREIEEDVVELIKFLRRDDLPFNHYRGKMVAAADVIEALLRAPEAAPGWQLVPKEPTTEMLDRAVLANGWSMEKNAMAYRAMLSAAPLTWNEK